jgi:hypothetical protein
MRTLDTLYRRAFIRAVLSTVAFAGCMIALLVTSAPADAQTVAQWQTLNEKCRGAQIDPDANPACKERQSVQTALAKKGWILANHEVWYTATQRAEFVNSILYAAQSQSMGYTSASLKGALLDAYRRAAKTMTDAQMIAIWNDTASQVEQQVPVAAVFGRQIALTLQSVHESEHDPRYTVDEQ